MHHTGQRKLRFRVFLSVSERFEMIRGPYYTETILDNTLQSRGAKRGWGEQSRDNSTRAGGARMGFEPVCGTSNPELFTGNSIWNWSVLAKIHSFWEPPIRSCLLVTRFQTGLFLVKNSKNGSLRQNIGKQMGEARAYVRAESPKNLRITTDRQQQTNYMFRCAHQRN